MPKQARALRTYDRVMDAAAFEFAHYGYAEANLQRIADRIGVTKGALYGHFATKEDLAAAFARHLAQVSGELLAEREHGHDSPVERLRYLLLETASLFQEDDHALAALRLAMDTARATDASMVLPGQLRQMAQGLVAQAQRDRLWNAAVGAGPLADLMVAALFGTFWTGSTKERSGLKGRMHSLWEVLALMLGGSADERPGAHRVP